MTGGICSPELALSPGEPLSACFVRFLVILGLRSFELAKILPPLFANFEVFRANAVSGRMRTLELSPLVLHRLGQGRVRSQIPHSANTMPTAIPVCVSRKALDHRNAFESCLAREKSRHCCQSAHAPTQRLAPVALVAPVALQVRSHLEQPHGNSAKKR
jgi:hypothetical protein